MIRADNHLHFVVSQLNGEGKLDITKNFNEDPRKKSFMTFVTWSGLCFHRYAYVWITVFVTLGVMNGVYYNIKHSTTADSIQHAISLVHQGNLDHWSPILSDTNYASIFCVSLIRSYCDMASLMVELLVIILCIAVKQHVDKFVLAASMVMLQSTMSGTQSVKQSDRDRWTCKPTLDELYSKYLALKRLISDTSDLVSPLIVLGYIYNVFVTLLNVSCDIFPWDIIIMSLKINNFAHIFNILDILLDQSKGRPS